MPLIPQVPQLNAQNFDFGWSKIKLFSLDKPYVGIFPQEVVS